MTTRRDVMRGLAVAAAAGAVGFSRVLAASPPSLFAGTPLADNRMARHFQRVDLALPAIPVVTAAGPASLAGVGGKARLLALWAEWCVPCLVEIRDLAAARPAVANDRFDIGLLLTASAAKLDRDAALAKLRPMGAGGVPLLVEPNGGEAAARALASRPDAPALPGNRPAFSLPCALLVDARGRVRGRTFGAPVAGSGVRIPLTPEQQAALKRGESVTRTVVIGDAEKASMLADGKTMWASPDGRAFLQALSEGALDRV